MNDEDIAALVVRAAKIAESAPTPLRPSAFEVVLKTLLSDGELDTSTGGDSVKPRRPRKPAKKAKPLKKATKASKSGGASSSPKAPGNGAASKKAKKTTSSGRPGPMVAVQSLVDSGFMKTGRTNVEICEHLRHSKGWTYKTTDMSPALVRMLRSTILEREVNSDGQYEFRER